MERNTKGKIDPVILPSGAEDEPTVSGIGGNYRVIRLLGRGTMASVYLAEQVSMARPVALKILPQALASDQEFVDRFLREARASARLNHPNIVAAIDFGEFQNRFFLAMEFVDGVPLSTLIEKDGAMEEKQVVGIALQVVSALSHAHMHQVVHLDVKPANIMICKNGRAKLADFGLAMILDRPGGAEASRRAAGTPYYMAPEQVEGGKLDWRADQYSLGASLYEAVTGKKPFTGHSVSDILVKRFFEKPEPAWKAGRRVSRGFSAILSKMLSRSPEGRYQSFADLENDLTLVKIGGKPAIARADSMATVAPSGTRWDSLGYAGVVGRIDGLLWRKRFTMVIHSCLLFLAVLGAYAALRSRELMGPTPPALVRSEALVRLNSLPEDVATPTRELWTGAAKLMAEAEANPTADNLRLALTQFRLISDNRELSGTAYAATARRRAAQLRRELEKMGIDASVDGYPGEENLLDLREATEMR